MRAKGTANGGVYQFGIPRAESITEGGMVIPPPMGLSTAVNFRATGNAKAAVTGDFVLLGSEVNPVMKSLRGSGIEVTTLHSHMVDENPRLYFMHFWATDDARRLARNLRAALDLMKNNQAPQRCTALKPNLRIAGLFLAAAAAAHARLDEMITKPVNSGIFNRLGHTRKRRRRSRSLLARCGR